MIIGWISLTVFPQIGIAYNLVYDIPHLNILGHNIAFCIFKYVLVQTKTN